MAHALGVELQTVDIRVPTDLAPAFASFRARGAEAINVLSSPILLGSREELGRLSLSYKLPAICEWRVMAEAGCVASYGYRQSEGWAMLAALTDKMLKGAPPGETPAQQPTKFELVVNLKPPRARHDDPAIDSRPRRRGHRVMNRRELMLLLGGAMTAARSAARAAEGDAGDRLPRRRVARRRLAVCGRVPPGTERNRLRRGTKRGDRIPLGGGSL